MNDPSIKEYFKGKTIFVTGGTGFVGKALLEKLLRSCPDLDKIYLLMRPRRGKSIHERLEQMISTSLFDLLRSKCPENFKKLIPINGDTALLSLGISDEDKQKLINEVQIFYHTAASVKFDDFLQSAILTNIRSAREAALLALEMKKIEAFMHTSTTFCNIDNRKVVEPVLYPPHGDWREAIMIAEKCDSHTVNILSQKYIGDFPNTYTFTKRLAEHCINDLLTGKIPTILFRPSVVVSTLSEPFQGWVDNFNGPVGLLMAGGTGALRTVYGDPEVITDYIAVDLIAKMMIVIVWHKALSRNKDELAIFQGSKYDLLPIKMNAAVELGKQLYWDVPFENKIWFPGNSMTKCWYNYYIQVLLFHMLPAFFVDILLRLAGHKPILFKVQRKIYIANMAIHYFMLNSWDFVNTNTLALLKEIPDNELDDFKFDIQPYTDEEIYEYYLNSCDQARQILLKENKEVTQKTRDRTLKMYYLDRACRWIFYAVMLWLVFYRINIIMLIWQAVVNYWVSL